MRMAHEWAAMFESYDAFAAAHPHGFYLTTFEDLTSPSTRLPALQDLLKVLGVPPQVPLNASPCASAAGSCEGGLHAVGEQNSVCQAGIGQGGNTQRAAEDGAAAVPAGCNKADVAARVGPAQPPQAASCAAGLESDSSPPSAAAAAGASVQEGYDAGRLQCAFHLARHPLIYRPKDPAGINAEYVYGGDVQLVCDVWGVVGARAAAHGYSVYGGVQC
jgi:hypothetical protein